MKLTLRLAAFAGACLLARPASAGDEGNPQPLADDFLLPLPGGTSMVFRAVPLGIGSEPTAEKKFRLGNRGEVNFREKLIPVKLSGAFLGEFNGRPDAYYLMGKYEVTCAQYQAVLGQGGAGASILPHPRQPQTGLTRQEILQFIATYNEWLRQHALAALPKSGGTPGVVRLPNEREWEFAARGGTAVASAQFEAALPWTDDVVRHAWLAGPRSSFDKLKDIGLLAPNPLGLHDMLGNAAEMSQDSYQVEYGQGDSGGSTVRGGSFRTTIEEARTSLRLEQPEFGSDNAPMRDDTVGFRLVLTKGQVFTGENIRALEEARSRVPPPAAPAGGTVAVPMLVAELQRRARLLAQEHEANLLSHGLVAQAGDRLRVLREMKIFYEKKEAGVAPAGHVYSVVADRPAEKKVYVLGSGARGEAIALQLAREGCQLLPRLAEDFFSGGLDRLRESKVTEALPFFEQAIKLDPARAEYAALRDALTGLLRSEQARLEAVAGEKQAEQLARQKLRNAQISDRPDRLVGGDANQRRAELQRREAAAIMPAAQARTAAAEAAAEQAWKVLQDYEAAQEENGAYDVVIALQRLMTAHGVASEGGAGAAEAVRQAQTLLAAAFEAQWSRRLYQGQALVAEGLKAMPGHRKLLKLQAELASDLALTERAAEALAKLHEAEEPGAAELLKVVRPFCQDSSRIEAFAKEPATE